jgi:membrane dipeptidase
VLYDSEDEFFHNANPVPDAFAHLLLQLQEVEDALSDDSSSVLAKNPHALEDAVNDPTKVAVFHALEGAFALSGDAGHVQDLANVGVAYVIVAHLFYRGVATCKNGFPGLPDLLFHLINPQPESLGLTQAGQEIVAALFDEGIVVDITHSSELAQQQIVDIWRGSYRNRPIISSHNGVQRAAAHDLNLTDDAVRAIADSGGVVGIIMSKYWLQSPDSSDSGDLNSVFHAIDAISELTGGSDEFVAIGTDLDGFIQPIDDFQNASFADTFADKIAAHYGDTSADKMLCGNALRALKAGWRGVAQS